MSRAERGLHAQVLEGLGQDIVDGRILSGTVVDLDEVREIFGVSRPVVREALRVLQSLGLVEPRQRVGTTVLSRDDWDLMAPMVIRWRGASPDYFAQQREMLELRLGIEPVAATMAARHPTVGEAVRSAADDMLLAVAERDDERYLDADVRFHAELLRGSGNAVFGHFAGTVEALLRTRTSERRRTITEWTPDAAHRHEAVALDLIAGDGAAAAASTESLIRVTIDEFVAEGAR